MAAIAAISIRVDKLPKEKFVQGKNGAVYYNCSVVLNDETNQYRSECFSNRFTI